MLPRRGRIVIPIYRRCWVKTSKVGQQPYGDSAHDYDGQKDGCQTSETFSSSFMCTLRSVFQIICVQHIEGSVCRCSNVVGDRPVSNSWSAHCSLKICSSSPITCIVSLCRYYKVYSNVSSRLVFVVCALKTFIS